MGWGGGGWGGVRNTPSRYGIGDKQPSAYQPPAQAELLVSLKRTTKMFNF